MNTKPRTTWKCRWVPRRAVPRTFKAQDVARITCKALRDGVSREEIERRIETTCPDQPKSKTSDALRLAQQAVAVAQGNIEVLNDSYNLFLTLNGILLALLALPALIRRSPGLFVIFRGVARVQTSVAAQVTVIGRQIAANDALFTQATVILRRAA